MIPSKLVAELISRAYFVLSTPINRKHTPRELILLKQRVGEGRAENKH